MSNPNAPAITGWGFVEINAEDYHADPAPRPSMSSGLLAKVVTGTIAEAKETHPRLTPSDEPEADNKKYDLGTVAHTMVLGKGREIVVVNEGDWKKKAAQEERKAAFAAGHQPCLVEVFERSQAMRTALFEQLADIKGEEDTFSPERGVAEQAGFWQEQTPLGKMWGRALYDWRHTGRLVIRDYKTYAGQLGADPDGFIKGLISTGKDIQDPWYSRGMAAIIGQQTGETIPWDAVDFKFIVQEAHQDDDRHAARAARRGRYPRRAQAAEGTRSPVRLRGEARHAAGQSGDTFGAGEGIRLGEDRGLPHMDRGRDCAVPRVS